MQSTGLPIRPTCQQNRSVSKGRTRAIRRATTTLRGIKSERLSLPNLLNTQGFSVIFTGGICQIRIEAFALPRQRTDSAARENSPRC
jgi:hypothetical protein